jgi:pimeloyl-ACP methyl ester carboxylesterase
MSDTTSTLSSPIVQKLTATAGRVNYFRSGEGAPAVFLHSAGGSATWTPLHTAVAARRDVIAPDHPGFGDTDDCLAIRDMDDVIYHYLEFFDRLGLERIDLIGTSFGGWIAAELAVHSPDRFRSLTLLAPAGLRVAGSEIANIFEMQPPQLVPALFHDSAIVDAILSTAPSPEAIARGGRDIAALARFGWEPLLANPQLAGRLGRIDIPTRVIAAGEDRIIPRVHCETYAARIPGAELFIVEGCGHALDGEKPAEVADLVTGFLAALDR